ncbi:hypothetical protein WJX79_007670 [Trebouxia sp. C0005]
MLDEFLQTFWTIVGAFSGLTIGLSREGAHFVASLGSVKGWKQIYTGSSSAKIKKIDNGDHLSKPLPRSDQEEITQFLGTRPPELKTSAPPPTYSNAPIIGGQSTLPAASPLASPRPQPVSQPAPPTQSATPMPFAMPVGTTSHPVLGDPLPDIFGASTSFMSSRPVQPAPAPVVNRPPSAISSLSPVKSTSSQAQSSTPPPAAITPPASPRPVNGSPTLAESYTDEDDLSTADETASSEANLTTGSKIKKLRKRISSKLKGNKA